MNLVINAAEAIGDEGQITVTTTNCHLEKSIFAYEQIKQGDYSVLSVSDTGMGISEQDLNRIFEPFYTKKIMGKSGTGLGMAVVWGTIKDHNAFIDVKSVQGLGTTFALFFPITDQINQSVDNTCAFAEYKGKGERILVVDDMEEQREITSRMLSRLGYAPVSVASGEEAVLHLKINSVDLIVLDMILEKGMDGLDTYKMILETNPHQKAIITSGFSETDRVKETQKLGAVQYLKKPYILEQLGKTIREELDR
jgi:CheY-like chemotaxis protein